MAYRRVIRVLVVDDSAPVRLGLSLFLEICDDMVMVGGAANGQEAIELCQQLEPDFVLMDLMMPVMDGIMATRIIHRDFPHIPIVILTTATDTKLVEAALQAGAVGYLQKGVSIDEIAETIRAAVKEVK
jgi:two-component system, NarL family, response regulator LiaR